MFEFVGIVLGLSIYNNTLLDIKFPRLIYKKLIYPDQNKLDCFEELAEIDPELQKSFGIAARKKVVLCFSTSIVAQQSVLFYRKLIK